MFFWRTIFTKPFDEFSCYFINIVFVFTFGFKVIICTVVIAHRCIPFDNTAAFFIQVADVFVVMLFHQIHGSHYVYVIKIRLFVIVTHFLERTELWIRINNSWKRNKSVYKIRIEFDFSVFSDILEKWAYFKFSVDILKKEIAYIFVCG